MRLVLLSFIVIAGSISSGQALDPAAESARASQFLVSGRPNEAIAIYAHLVRAYPGNSDLLLNLCIAEFKAERYNDSIEHARAALNVNPALAPASLFLGASYLKLGQYRNAVEPLQKASQVMTGDRNARLMLAEAFLGSKRYPEALPQFLSSSELLPNSPRVWYGLGQTYDGLAERASLDLQSMAPDSGYWWALAGDSYLQQRRFGSAFAAYREALARGAKVPGIHAGLARVYRSTGHAEWAAHEESLETNVTRIETKESGPAASYWSCKSYRDLAARAYQRLRELPPSLESHLHGARLLDGEGRYRDAADEWRKSLTLAPGDLEVRMGLAWSLYKSGDYDSILPLLKDILKENPKSSDANFIYGASLLSLEQPDAAIPYLAAALKEDPQMRAACAALGQALLRNGKPGDAIPYLKGAILSDKDGNTHFQLFRAYQLTGENLLAKQALEAYRQFKTSVDQKSKAEEGWQITAPEN